MCEILDVRVNPSNEDTEHIIITMNVFYLYVSMVWILPATAGRCPSRHLPLLLIAVSAAQLTVSWEQLIAALDVASRSNYCGLAAGPARPERDSADGLHTVPAS